MKTEEKTKGSCPGDLELGSWFEGEGPSSLTPHVESCARCQKRIRLYRRADLVAKAMMAPPAGLEDRVLAACRNAGDATGKTPILAFPGYRLMGRIAAVLLVVVAVWGVVATIGDRHVGRSAAGRSDLEPERSAPSVQDLLAYAPDGRAGLAAGAMGARDRELPSGQTINSGMLRPVSQDQSDGGDGGAQFGTIAPKVSHVWVGRDLRKGQLEIMRALPKRARMLEAKELEDGILQFLFVLSDRDLQTYVDSLATRGFSLVSPDLPQPGQSASTVATENDVLYILRLVEE